MRLSQQLVLFVLAAAVLPLAMVGFWLLKQSEAELTIRLAAAQRAQAQAAAEAAGYRLSGALNALQSSAGLITWATASPDEISGGLGLLGSQSDLVSGIALVDPNRDDVPPPMSGGEGHATFDEEKDGAALLKSLPFEPLGERGNKGQVAVGTALDASGPVLPVGVQVSQKGPKAAFIVAFLSLGGLQKELAQRAEPPLTIELTDSDNRVLARSSGGTVLEPLDPARAAQLEGAEVGRTQTGEWVAWAPVPGPLGLKAVVSLPGAVATGPLMALRRSVLAGIAVTLVLLIIAGLTFTGRLNRRLGRVASVADAYSKGELNRRIIVDGQDELADLGNTFNRMGAELETARTKLMRWNDDLKQRVDEATADLRAAQGQLIEAQKLAAIGQLGAGVAHEINNPLCGILGNAQLLMLEKEAGSDDFELLKKIEESAKRCRDITQNLLRFSQSAGRAERRPSDLNALVRGTLAFEKPRFLEAKIDVGEVLAPGNAMTWGDPEQLAQSLQQLCSNARTAMLNAKVKRLTVATFPKGNEWIIEITDTGKGIPAENMSRIFDPFFTTKDIWSNVGLGLSVVYRVVKEHEGRVEVDSKVGEGTRFVVHLPKYDPAVHQQKAMPAQAAKPTTAGGTGLGIVK
jgi:signal transduction histidine kinase